MTPLLLALHVGNEDLITVLIENGTDINTSVNVRKSSIQLLSSLLCNRSVLVFHP